MSTPPAKQADPQKQSTQKNPAAKAKGRPRKKPVSPPQEDSQQEDHSVPEPAVPAAEVPLTGTAASAAATLTTVPHADLHVVRENQNEAARQLFTAPQLIDDDTEQSDADC
eukprot:3276572-Amphidinium_carterae.1